MSLLCPVDYLFPLLNNLPHSMHGTIHTRAGMGRAARSLLIGSQDTRPDPQYMARLILQGLTEEVLQDTWYESGNPLPHMRSALSETNTLIPFIQRASDTLAKDKSDELKLFAARDADCLYDDYAIVHPLDTRKARFPASSEMWESAAWADTRLARSFLKHYGLTRHVIMNTDRLVTVIDSGFFGTVGTHLNDKVKDVYDYSLSDERRLNVQLIHAEKYAVGTEIMRIKSKDLPRARKMLPRASLRDDNSYHHCNEPGYLVAAAIELMPHYHGAFTGFARHKGRLVVTTREEKMTQNVDNPHQNSDSIVNRLAAAMVQYRIVHAALERTPYADILPTPSGQSRPVSKVLQRHLQAHGLIPQDQ